MKFDRFSIVRKLGMNVRDIVERDGNPARILDSAGQFERFLVRTEGMAAISQHRVYPTNVVQVDGHVPSAVVRAVDLERRNVCIERFLILCESRVCPSDVILLKCLGGAISQFPPERKPVLMALEGELVVSQVVV